MIENFAASTRDAGKILAIEIAGLGDLVHSLPSLWALRQSYPRAELHCLVQQGNASLLRLTPWIDRVLPYRRGAAGDMQHHLEVARELRSQHYDVAVDLIGADYSSAVARISGAARRLVRKPGPARPRHGWRLFGTDIVDSPFYVEPMYRQRLRCLHQAGIETAMKPFELPAAGNPTAPRVAGHAGYIHVSPCTKIQRKELPLEQLADLLTQVMDTFPDHRLVISGSDRAREGLALSRLLELLPFEPWKVFAGTLDIPQLYALIDGAALHLGGDTGTMHLAWLAGTPSVNWCRASISPRQWLPNGRQHAVVISPLDPMDQLKGIDNALVVERAREVIVQPAACSWTFDEVAISVPQPRPIATVNGLGAIGLQPHAAH